MSIFRINFAHPFVAEARSAPASTQSLIVRLPSARSRALLPSPLVSNYSLAEAVNLKRIYIFGHDPETTGSGDIFTGATMDKFYLAFLRIMETLNPAAEIEVVKILLKGYVDVLYGLGEILKALPCGTKHIILDMKLSFAPDCGMTNWKTRQSFFDSAPKGDEKPLLHSLERCRALESATIVWRTPCLDLDPTKLFQLAMPPSLRHLQLFFQFVTPAGPRFMDFALYPVIELTGPLEELYINPKCTKEQTVRFGKQRWMARTPPPAAPEFFGDEPRWPFPQHFSGTVPYIPNVSNK